MDAALLKTDFEIVALDQDTDSVDVELAALKRSDVEPLERAVARWGLRLRSIHLGCASDTRPRFNFGASHSRLTRFAITRVDTLWAASAAALAFCAVIVFTVQSVRAQKSLDRALAQTSAQAAAALQQRQGLLARLETLSWVAQAERAPTAAMVLADVTAHLNREAWLTVFELKGRDLRLVGLSSEPATIVKALAGSTLITDVELRSSMSAGTNSGKDRFEITAQVRAGT